MAMGSYGHENLKKLFNAENSFTPVNSYDTRTNLSNKLHHHPKIREKNPTTQN